MSRFDLAHGNPATRQFDVASLSPAILIIVVGLLFHVLPTLVLAATTAVSMILLAYHMPRTTIALTIVFGQFAQFELAPLIGISSDGIPVGSIFLRLSDPFLFGIVSTLIIRFLAGDKRLLLFGKAGGWIFFIFLTYLLCHVLVHLPSFGVSAMGEFRTYYQFLFFVPYIVISAPTEESRRKMFLLLISLSFANIIWGALRGAVLYGFTFGAYDKWLSGFGSLSLLYGIYGYSAVIRQKMISPGLVQRALVYGLSIGLLFVAGARAVWLAGGVGLIAIAWSEGIRLRWFAAAISVVILSLALTYPFFSVSGLNPVEFFAGRLLAFTDFSADPTAAWRYSFWGATIEQILIRPWFGAGLGLHFDIYIPEFGELATTSPHNLYLSLLFQIGIIGLLLYFAWIITVGIRMKKRGRVTDAAILATGFLVLLSVHAYGIAYSFEKDFFTWCYVGLGISAMIDSDARISEKALTDRT